MKKSNLVFISIIILFSLNVVLVKADLVITVKYSDGCPVEGATVRVYTSCCDPVNEVCVGNTNKNGRITCKPPGEVPICPYTYTFRVVINGVEKDIGYVDVDVTCTGNKTSNLAESCPSGYCVDGYCCNSVCTETCKACNLVGSEGTCSFIPSGQDPVNECSGNNLIEISICNNNPDNNPFTFDYAPAFTSTCNGNGQCTTGSQTVSHTCADSDSLDNEPIIPTGNGVRTCTAPCDQKSDCPYNRNCQADCTCELPTCGLTVTGGSPIPFGNVDAGQTSNPQTVDILNSGNSPTTDFKVYGINWSGTGHTMLVGQTSVNDVAWKTLTVSPGITIYTGVINNGETKYPQFNVSIPEGQTQDTYSQTITFTGSC